MDASPLKEMAKEFLDRDLRKLRCVQQQGKKVDGDGRGGLFPDKRQMCECFYENFTDLGAIVAIKTHAAHSWMSASSQDTTDCFENIKKLLKEVVDAAAAGVESEEEWEMRARGRERESEEGLLT